MRTASPLRYPGGKAALSSLLGSIRRINGLGRLALSEPFAGGAGAALSLLYREQVRQITINDMDESVFSFWWTLVHRPGPLIDLIEKTPVNIEEWRKQRDLHLSGRGSRVRRGFAAFYLNRCNRSGIIMNGGPVGGVDQKGKWKIDARYNKGTLVARCKRVVEYRKRIQVSQADGLEVIRSRKDGEVMHFIDPPYYRKGASLYLNSIDEAYHARLAKELQGRQGEAWVVTYDDCDEIRDLYEGWASVRPFGLRYVASERRSGREVMITPRWMRLPLEQGSMAIAW